MKDTRWIIFFLEDDQLQPIQYCIGKDNLPDNRATFLLSLRIKDKKIIYWLHL